MKPKIESGKSRQQTRAGSRTPAPNSHLRATGRQPGFPVCGRASAHSHRELIAAPHRVHQAGRPERHRFQDAQPR